MFVSWNGDGDGDGKACVLSWVVWLLLLRGRRSALVSWVVDGRGAGVSEWEHFWLAGLLNGCFGRVFFGQLFLGSCWV
ncbi:hypothetical protein QBC39DRAFT_357544, partial [Podospora conica]